MCIQFKGNEQKIALIGKAGFIEGRMQAHTKVTSYEIPAAPTARKHTCSIVAQGGHMSGCHRTSTQPQPASVLIVGVAGLGPEPCTSMVDIYRMPAMCIA